MPWFRVDDQFWQHPKLMGIPTRYRNDAAGLWTRAGSYCSMNLTDGYIEASVPGDLLDGNRATVGRLVFTGLWVPAPEGGWQMHDWSSWQPTRALLEERRAADRQRKRLERGIP